VWPLSRLATELGAATFGVLWARIRGAAAAAAAAALAPLQAGHAWLAPPVEHYGFQVLGLDFMMDAALTPWLLEANSAPSIMAVHSDGATRRLIRETKQRMLGDALAMVAHRFVPGVGGGPGPGARAGWQQQLAAEMAGRGGFEPLMGAFRALQLEQAEQLLRRGEGEGLGQGQQGQGGSRGQGLAIPWRRQDIELQAELCKEGS
jgi:hypothetical protein